MPGPGVLLTSTEDIFGLWKEFFGDLLNDMASINEAESGDEEDDLPVTRSDIIKADSHPQFRLVRCCSSVLINIPLQYREEV